jgi:hypothetical protein
MNLEKLIEAYNAQTAQAFSHGQNVLFKSEGLGSGIDYDNLLSNPYGTGGIFADCALEAPVMNLLIQPIYSMANLIPVSPNSNDKIKYAFLSSIGAPTGTYPDTPCDDSPIVGDIGAAYAEFYPGRISYRTKTMELDKLIQTAHAGIRENLYLVGNVRGVSAVPTMAQMQDRAFVERAAVRRQMATLMRQMQIDLVHQFWNGDPADTDLNTTNGGRSEFWGLNNLIANDYGSKSFITGTNKTLLNSYVLDFQEDSQDGIIGGGVGIYEYLQQLEDVVYQRAAMMGLLPTTWNWVMHPITWSELVKYLPCEMLTDSCGVPATAEGLTGAGVQVMVNGSDGMGVQALRQQLMNNMALTVNGRTHRVVLDSGAPIVQSDDGEEPPVLIPEYTGSIYLVPTNVAGENTLEWVHRDYRGFEQQLAPIPSSADVGLRGWTDGGRFHSIVERRKRCFEIDIKTELGLIFRAPHLAGRLDNVVSAPKGFRPRFDFTANMLDTSE